MKIMKLAAAVALSTVAASGPTLAATATANLTVKIIITNECKVATPADLDFGSRGVLDQNFDATTTISVTCTTGQTYNVGLGAGTGPSPTVTARKMKNGTDIVAYGLYKTAARAAGDNWGDTGTDRMAGTGTGAAQSLTVYGRVPPQTTPPANTYTDTVAITVTY